MALPKEPRQKMINIMYLVLTALLALNVSVEILNAFKTVQSSLDKSSVSIDNSNAILFDQLKAKYEDQKTQAQAAVYKPWADKAKEICEKAYIDLDKYKDTVMNKSGRNLSQGIEEFNYADIETPTYLFIEHDNGKKLLAELTQVQNDLLNISPEISKEFEGKLPIDLNPPPAEKGNAFISWEYSYFHMTPTIAALTMLSKFQNDIKNSEIMIR